MLDRWLLAFPDAEPIAYELKLRFTDRWIRFHSLPESKRYAVDDGEWRMLIDRHNAVLAALAGASRHVVVLTTDTSPSSPFPRPWRSLDVDGATWHVYARAAEWQPGVFDAELRRVASWEQVNWMVCDTECRWLFAPYDGGMDVVLESPAARDRLAHRFGEWRSHRRDGL